MNYTDFNIAGGLPFNQARLKFLQDTWLLAFLNIGKWIAGGGTAVLSGCVVTGTTMSDGWVVHEGEILPFIGGIVGTHFEIIEHSEPISGLVYFDVANNQTATHNPQRVRYAQWGATIPWQPVYLNNGAAQILASVQNSPIKYQGSVNVGNIYSPPAYPNETFITVNLPNIQPPYMVVGELQGNHPSNLDADDAITYTVSNKTADDFKVAFRHNNPALSGSAAAITFNFIVFKF